jgi:hypothetical protein
MSYFPDIPQLLQFHMPSNWRQNFKVKSRQKRVLYIKKTPKTLIHYKNRRKYYFEE